MRNRMKELSRGIKKTKRPAARSRAMGTPTSELVYARAFDDGQAIDIERRGTRDGAASHPTFASPRWGSVGVAAEAELVPQVESFVDPSGQEHGAHLEDPAPNPEVVHPGIQRTSESTPTPSAGPQDALDPTIEAAQDQRPSVEHRPHIDPSAEPVAHVDEDTKQFTDDIQALLQQANGDGSPAAGPLQPRPNAAAPPATAVAQSADPHDIFNRMDMSMANSFSGAALDLTPKFETFDQALAQPAKHAVIDVGPTPLETFDASVAPSDMDVIEDLAFITSEASPSTAVQEETLEDQGDAARSLEVSEGKSGAIPERESPRASSATNSGLDGRSS